MSIEYAKELLSVECGRIVSILEDMAREDPGLSVLTERERWCWGELRGMAEACAKVFRVTGGGGGK